MWSTLYEWVLQALLLKHLDTNLKDQLNRVRFLFLLQKTVKKKEEVSCFSGSKMVYFPPRGQYAIVHG